MPILLPATASILASHHLTVAGHDLCDLAQRWGTPLYIYDAETIRQRAGRLPALLQAAYPGPSQVTYAAKAYFSLGIARKLAACGLGVDVVSLGELGIARQAGFAPQVVHLHGNNKSAWELEAALRWGVQSIVVDSLEELAFLDGLATRLSEAGQIDQPGRIWLRITPGLNVHTHAYRQTGHHGSKFGLPIHDGQAAQAIRMAKTCRWLRLTGLHTHLGSQLFETDPYRQAIAMLLDLAAGEDFIPEELSPGGGWGVTYSDADPTPTEGVEDWVKAVSESVQAGCQKLDWPLPRLVIEPGRWIVAQAGMALYSVGTTKLAGETHIVAVDGGMADNPRPALYQARYTALLANRADEAPHETYSVVGKFCESGDQLIPAVALPEPQRGDILAIPVAGAYQLSMASNYNLAGRPAVLWLDQDNIEVLQHRETVEESGWWVS
jgi:diaminopimelate decarboxylase